MNRYSFIKSAQTQVTTKDIAAAKEVSSIEAILAAAKSIGEFEFSEDKNLSDYFRKNAKSIAVLVETLQNGAEVNRAKIVTDNGTYRVRCYGAGRGEIVPEAVFTDAEIKKAVFGFCTSDGEKVAETKISPDGEIVKTPVIYLRIA